MFPDVRLMIVAIFSSIVALICGFGVFAAFRVNHEPLARLPSAAESLQFVAGNAAPPAMMVAAIEPFDHRLGISGPLIAQSSEHPAIKAVQSIADDHAVAASGAESETARAAAPGADASTASQVTQVSESEREATPAGAAEAHGGPVLAPAPQIAVSEPSTDQARPTEQTAPETEIAPAVTFDEVAVVTPTPKTVVKKVARPRVARTPRVRRSRARAFAQYNASQFISAEPNFQSVPRPARVRRYVTSRRPSSAVGGPFIGPKGQ